MRGKIIIAIILILSLFTSCKTESDKSAEIQGRDYEPYFNMTKEEVLAKLDEEKVSYNLFETLPDAHTEVYQTTETIHDRDYTVLLTFYENEKGDWKLLRYTKETSSSDSDQYVELSNLKQEWYEAITDQYGQPSVNAGSGFAWETMDRPINLGFASSNDGLWQGTLSFTQYNKALQEEAIDRIYAK